MSPTLTNPLRPALLAAARSERIERTVSRSRLTRSANVLLWQLYRRLLAIRPLLQREIHASWDEPKRTLTIRRGDVALVANFAETTIEFRPPLADIERRLGLSEQAR